jgi:hypothetical protein
MKQFISSLKDWSQKLLDTNLVEAQAEEILAAIHERLVEMTGVTAATSPQDYIRDTSLEFGNAICTNEAAKCILDTWRTVKFLRGTYGAIRHCQSKNPSEKIQLLYAGCGPHALFLTLLAPMFEEGEIGFTLLEVNPASFQIAQRLVRQLGLEGYMDSIHLEDAIRYRVPNSKQFHILFSETMDKALCNEAFVPILLNLRPQLGDDVIVIPTNVVVGATLFPRIKRADGLYPQAADFKGVKGHSLGVVLDLASKLKENGSWGLAVPVKGLSKFRHLAFNTEVSIWGDIVLGQWESHITMPKIEAISASPTDRQIQFEYPLERALGIRISTS